MTHDSHQHTIRMPRRQSTIKNLTFWSMASWTNANAASFLSGLDGPAGRMAPMCVGLPRSPIVAARVGRAVAARLRPIGQNKIAQQPTEQNLGRPRPAAFARLDHDLIGHGRQFLPGNWPDVVDCVTCSSPARPIPQASGLPWRAQAAWGGSSPSPRVADVRGNLNVVNLAAAGPAGSRNTVGLPTVAREQLDENWLQSAPHRDSRRHCPRVSAGRPRSVWLATSTAVSDAGRASFDGARRSTRNSLCRQSRVSVGNRQARHDGRGLFLRKMKRRRQCERSSGLA